MRVKYTRIKKVKVADDKIKIIYERFNETTRTWDEYSVSCSDLARPEFYAALKALAPHVIEMCELPEEYVDRIKVTGVTFDYSGKDEVMGAVIIAQMKLDKSYTNLNLTTPHKASAPYSEYSPPDPMQLLTPECIAALDNLCDEVKTYLRGERAQLSMFFTAIEGTLGGGAEE